MAKRLNKKQRKLVANLWAAGILYATGMDAFDDDVEYEDQGEITEMVQSFGTKLLGHHPLMHSLPEIVNYVKSLSKHGTVNG